MTSLPLRAGLAIVLFLSAAHGQGLFPRPGAESGPTTVHVAIYVNDLLKVDGADQLVSADFFLAQNWHDPAEAGGEPRVVAPAEVWTPQIVVVNEGRLFPRLPGQVEIDAEGNLHTVQRFVGTLTNRFDLTRFPFDHQVFRIHATTRGTADEIDVRNLDGKSGQNTSLTLPDWKTGQGHASIATYYFAPGNELLTGLAYEIPASRRVAYYLWKVIIPLSLVVLMASSVFWIDANQLGPRLSVAVTSMLTLIAYRFVLGAMLPHLSYLTRMDWYTLGCTALVFAALIEVVSSGFLTRTKREAQAERLDQICRWGFPVAFASVFAGSFLV